jgi:sulfate permease, SulP family
MLKRLLPFLDWFRGYSLSGFRADVVSGVTVALVLIPQSMAYAQLAGLPPHYGLYASFLPPLVAALFGSSRQLATGPVAVVSLMTAATLETLATAGCEGYIAYAILLSLLVGLFQLALGVLRLGIVVNFLSHPVVNGFTNAAALIIATSQLSKLFGVHVEKAEHHYETVVRVVSSAIHYTHLPTLLLAVLSFAIMIGLKKVSRKIPYVLAAVVVTTVISFFSGFEHRESAPLESIRSEKVHRLVREFNGHLTEIDVMSEERGNLSTALKEIEEQSGTRSTAWVRVHSDLEVQSLQLENAQKEASGIRDILRSVHFCATAGEDGGRVYFPVGEAPPGPALDGEKWRIEVGCHAIDDQAVSMSGGGDVVGAIPSGLPTISMPVIDFSLASRLFSAAVIISLLGFMEAISIAKAMSVKTGQRLNPNQELVGQGLANIVGAFSQGYPVSGSFSRSAVNLQAGAVTGLSSAFTSVVVVIVLLFFTPLLYHLPQSVLASVIMMAVLGLLNVSGFVHAYRAKRADAIISLISFVLTLYFAPHLDKGILVGVGLSIALFLYEYMKTRLTVLSLHPDGAYRDADRWHLAKCRHILPVRFFGKLFFANTSALEKRILELVQENPELRHVVIVGNGMSDIDASGEEILDQIVDELRRRGLGVAFSGLRDPVRDVLTRTRLLEKIGEENIYPSMAHASRALCREAQDAEGAHSCPLCTPIQSGEPAGPHDPIQKPEGEAH